MTSARLKFSTVIDLLDHIRYLNDAVFMAAGDSGLTADATNALQALSGVIDKEIQRAAERLEEALEDLQ